jgi:diguanylate cyclase (GGDEF)-like protein/PAS domain S-box-containing protein
MPDRTELLEAALDSFPEGVGLADFEGRVAFWNQAAQAITGYSGAKLVGLPVREALNALIAGGAQHWINQTDNQSRGVRVHVRHHLGHNFPAIARILVLRDGLGARIGTGVLFHSAEGIDALPRGETGQDSRVGESQMELEERLAALFEDFERGDMPLGVLWVTVDQARGLRQTHGARACEAMLEKLERTVANGLKPSEEIGSWGDDEFLVVCHERNAAMLSAHAKTLAGLARTTDFRWWGDRVSLTVSIGAAQAEAGESLTQLLERAQSAMLSSLHMGGNHITSAHGRQACSPL